MSEAAHDPECDCREAEARSKDDFKGRHFEAALILQAARRFNFFQKS